MIANMGTDKPVDIQAVPWAAYTWLNNDTNAYVS